MSKKENQSRRLTVHQAKILTIFTGYQLIPFSMVHKDIQSRLGGGLIAIQNYSDSEFIKEVQEVYREDLLKILPQISLDEIAKHEGESTDD